ncbi:hypothetical protein E2562_039394 [Oryza meyeriana var. granulata]|uniref:Uncharacterized protein n=1 Tax=Oryza meyeriana var. granulata TaxID=110450 RepID=A0A6G1EUJ0_9ORYZ|nr:hypothetical protein E2562_039394 [Oryza meyeriana var. granulata]
MSTLGSLSQEGGAVAATFPSLAPSASPAPAQIESASSQDPNTVSAQQASEGADVHVIEIDDDVADGNKNKLRYAVRPREGCPGC